MATMTGIPGRARQITASDITIWRDTPGCLHIGSAGNAKVETEQGDVVTFYGLSAGDVIPCKVIRLYSTGSTVSNCVLVYGL